jgi:hypothetical protein
MLALDPEHGVVRLVPGEHVGAERQLLGRRVRARFVLVLAEQPDEVGTPVAGCSAVRPYVSMRYYALSGSGV